MAYFQMRHGEPGRRAGVASLCCARVWYAALAPGAVFFLTSFCESKTQIAVAELLASHVASHILAAGFCELRHHGLHRLNDGFLFVCQGISLLSIIDNVSWFEWVQSEVRDVGGRREIVLGVGDRTSASLGKTVAFPAVLMQIFEMGLAELVQLWQNELVR